MWLYALNLCTLSPPLSGVGLAYLGASKLFRHMQFVTAWSKSLVVVNLSIFGLPGHFQVVLLLFGLRGLVGS